MVAEQQTEALFGTFAFQAPFAKSYKIYDYSAYHNAFVHAIQEVAKNLATPQQALEDAQTKITCVIKKEKGLVDAGTDCNL